MWTSRPSIESSSPASCFEPLDMLNRQSALPIQDLGNNAGGSEHIHQVFLLQTVRFDQFVQYLGWLGGLEGVRLVPRNPRSAMSAVRPSAVLPERICPSGPIPPASPNSVHSLSRCGSHTATLSPGGQRIQDGWLRGSSFPFLLIVFSVR